MRLRDERDGGAAESEAERTEVREALLPVCHRVCVVDVAAAGAAARVGEWSGEWMEGG